MVGVTDALQLVEHAQREEERPPLGIFAVAVLGGKWHFKRGQFA